MHASATGFLSKGRHRLEPPPSPQARHQVLASAPQAGLTESPRQSPQLRPTMATDTANSITPSGGPHPLQFKWTFWHNISSKGKIGNYAEHLREVASFDTIEDFWALFNNLMQPSELAVGNTYNLFKYGIEPKWEDIQNRAGGEWRLLNPGSRKTQLDEFWINTVLTVIGEGFSPEESDDISGIVVNIKRGTDRIAIWTKTALDQSLQESIGRRWRESASIRPMIEYTTFKDAMGGRSSNKPRSRYQVE